MLHYFKRFVVGALVICGVFAVAGCSDGPGSPDQDGGGDVLGADAADVIAGDAAGDATLDVCDVRDAADDAADAGDAAEVKTCSVRAHGATGDGTTLDTAAIQAAIDECAGTGGVTVVEPGTYYTGTIFLKSDMTFRIAEGATILGSTSEADYSGEVLVAIQHARNVTVEGPGTIDGNGPNWWFWHWINPDSYRPGRMVQPLDSRNLVFRNLRLQNSAGWHFHILACDDVVVDGVTIRTVAGPTDQSPNTDGIDIDACRNVEVMNCDIETGDDCIVLKNGYAEWARDSYGINVHDCTVAGWANGLKIGTRPMQPVHDVTFRDIVIRASVYSNAGTRVMGGITLVSDDGSEVYDILAENIHMTAVRSPFFLRTQERLLDDEGGRISSAGRIYNVTLRNITVDDAQIPGMIMGIPEHPVENVTLENVSITSSVAGTEADRALVPDERNMEYPDAIYFGTMPAYGVYARHVAGPLVFGAPVTFQPAADEKRAAVILDDVTDFDLSGITGDPEIIGGGD